MRKVKSPYFGGVRACGTLIDVCQVVQGHPFSSSKNENTQWVQLGSTSERFVFPLI